MSASHSAPASVGEQPSFARLHGLACWHCGAVATDLQVAGEVTLDDETRAWPVVACPAHQGRGLL